MFKLIRYADENQKVKYGLLCQFLTYEKKEDDAIKQPYKDDRSLVEIKPFVSLYTPSIILNNK